MSDDVTAASSAASTPAASSPATPAPASPTPASASTTPSGTPDSSVTPATEQHVPYARFQEVNNSLKAAKAFQEKYGWASQFESEPFQFVDSWIDQLAQHPQHQQAIYAKAARMLASRRGMNAPAQPVEEPQADVPIVDGNGNVTGQTYSAKQLKAWREWDWAQRESALGERFKPLEQLNQRVQQAERKEQAQQQATAQVGEILTTLRLNPYFKEHEAKVKQALIDHEEFGDNVHAAFNHVLTTELLPNLSRTEQQKVLDSLQNKVAGATVNPGNSAPAAKPKFKDFGEAARYYEAHPDEAAAMAKLG